MIAKHCPWGRPGGGAPSEHIRRGNILQDGLFPEYGNVCFITLEIVGSY